MEKNSRVRISIGTGPGFYLNILFFIFLFLKLAEWGVVKHWSWWVVTAPLWGPILVTMIIIMALMIAIGIGKALRKINGGF